MGQRRAGGVAGRSPKGRLYDHRRKNSSRYSPQVSCWYTGAGAIPTGGEAPRCRTPACAQPGLLVIGLLVISGRPLTHCEVGIPKTEGPEEDRNEVLNPAVKCCYAEYRRRQMGRRGVDEDTDQKVDRDDNAASTKERPDKVHSTSSLRTLELRDLAVDKSSATS